MKVRDFLFQSCLIQKWEFQFPTFAPLLQEREKRPFQCAFVAKQLLNMYIKSRRLVCTNAAGRCELVFLSDAHCRQETAVNYSISWQTMSPLIDPNRIPSPRTHYAIDWAAIISRTGEPFLHARNS